MGSERVGYTELLNWTECIYKIDNQQRPTLKHRELYSIFCNKQSGKKVWERMDIYIYISSVQLLSHVRHFVTPQNSAHQASCPSPPPRVHSNSCPSSRWCNPAISSSVIPFSSCLQPFLASGSFQMNQFFASGDQSIGASTTVLTMNIHSWFPLRLIGLISLQSKGLSRFFFSTTIRKHQDLFHWVCFPHQVAKLLEFQL